MGREDLPPDEQPVDTAFADGAITAASADDRQWGMFAHLAALIALLIGGMTFIGPLIVWIIKKDQSRFVDYHGKESLNFQLNVLIYNVILVVIAIATCGMGLFVTAPIHGVIVILAVIMPIVAGMAANRGELYRYPLTFRILH